MRERRTGRAGLMSPLSGMSPQGICLCLDGYCCLCLDGYCHLSGSSEVWYRAVSLNH